MKKVNAKAKVTGTKKRPMGKKSPKAKSKSTPKGGATKVPYNAKF